MGAGGLAHCGARVERARAGTCRPHVQGCAHSRHNPQGAPSAAASSGARECELMQLSRLWTSGQRLVAEVTDHEHSRFERSSTPHRRRAPSAFYRRECMRGTSVLREARRSQSPTSGCRHSSSSMTTISRSAPSRMVTRCAVIGRAAG